MSDVMFRKIRIGDWTFGRNPYDGWRGVSDGGSVYRGFKTRRAAMARVAQFDERVREWLNVHDWGE